MKEKHLQKQILYTICIHPGCGKRFWEFTHMYRLDLNMFKNVLKMLVNFSLLLILGILLIKIDLNKKIFLNSFFLFPIKI